MQVFQHYGREDKDNGHEDDEESLRPITWPETLIGRRHETEIIDSMLNMRPFTQRLLYFKGEGGIGKTRLLSEAAAHAGRLPDILTTEVIDLYHFRYHQPMAMMLTIAQHLRASLKGKNDLRPAFENFFQSIDTYLLRSGGVPIDRFANNGGSVAIEVEVRKQLTGVFVKDYEKLAADFGIVLLIDTFEKLHPIIEETKEFNFRQASHFEDWIVADFIPRLPNTLTVLAGRDNERQSRLLANSKLKVETIKVQPLTEAETIQFIEASLQNYLHLIDPDLIQQLYHYSHGKPVVLSLALAYLQIEEMALPLRAGSEVDEDSLIREIVSSLQMKKPLIANLLLRAFQLRKGLNIDLLMQIDNEPDKDKVRQRINLYAQLPFFKRIGRLRAEESVAVLHDELYDRFYGRLPQNDARYVYDLAIDHIEGLINQRLAQLEQGDSHTQNWLRAVAPLEVGEEAADKSTRLQAAQEIRLMRVEQLFYELARNPKRGYQQYRRLSNGAIQAYDEDFDTLLQDEIARFFELTPGIEQGWGETYRQELVLMGVSWDQVVFEEGVRWVERRLNAYEPGEDSYTKALEIADAVQQRYPHVYQENMVARYALDAVRLRAGMYQSSKAINGLDIRTRFEEVAQELAELIGQLEAEHIDHPAMDEDDLAIQDAETRYAKLVLATLYNDFGYYERMQERYKSAADKYTQSIRIYNQLGSETNGLRAVTLNNLAFARHQQGFSKRALGLVNTALRLATKYGSPHQIATTLNTLARIELRYSHATEGNAYSTVSKARTIFETLKSGRGSALCALTEGNVLRSRAASHVRSSHHNIYDRENTKQDYERAIRRYQYAMEKFDEQPQTSNQQPQSELLHRIEARVGLGAVYRERGLLQRQSAVFLDDINPDDDLQTALRIAEEAWSLCNEDVPGVTRVAILEDMAFVSIEQGNFETAREKLKEAHGIIPKEYSFQEGMGIVYNLEMEENWIYWFRLGQLELQDALIELRTGSATAGCTHLLRSFACLHTFSPYTPLKRAVRELGKHELQHAIERAYETEYFDEKITELRHATKAQAARLHIPEAVIVDMDEMFDELEGLSLDEQELM